MGDIFFKNNPTKKGGQPETKGITQTLGKLQPESLRIVAGAFKSTPIRNLETETWVPPLDLYFNKRLADFEARLQQNALDDGQGGRTTPGSIVHAACGKIYRRSQLKGEQQRPTASLGTTGAHSSGKSRHHNCGMDGGNSRHGQGSAGGLGREMAEGTRRPGSYKASR